MDSTRQGGGGWFAWTLIAVAACGGEARGGLGRNAPEDAGADPGGGRGSRAGAGGAPATGTGGRLPASSGGSGIGGDPGIGGAFGTGNAPTAGGAPGAGGRLVTGGSAGSGSAGAAGSGGFAPEDGGVAPGGGTPGSGGFPWPFPLPDAAGIPDGPQLCGGVECAPGEACCLADLRCFDPAADAGACTGTPPPGVDPAQVCWSSADCEAGWFCRTRNQSLCGGPGECLPQWNCGGCLGSNCEACGCDGKTYPDPQTACLAGVRALLGACGVDTPVDDGEEEGGPPPTFRRCGIDAHCVSGERCCPITATCYDPALPELCRMPPDDASVPCYVDRHCLPNYWEFCLGDGCEGPGGCVNPGEYECTGRFDPVCGCDGNTYTNRGCALIQGVRIASPGLCP